MGVSVETTAVPLAMKSSSLGHLANGAFELNLHHHHHHHVSFADRPKVVEMAADEEAAETQQEAVAVAASDERGSDRKQENNDDEDGKRDEEEEEEDEEEEEENEYVLPRDIITWGVDQRDVRTADEWIPRRSEMVRLTGRHPFNSEPPLSVLMRHGFITPASLHYVRNHGPVPRASWDDWRISITGLVRKPLTLNMEDIAGGRRFKHREIPVTLVCAGNRRKEENAVAQSIGFNWGPAGISTSLWRGVRLCDVLREAAPMLRRRRGGAARFVCFEGADSLTKCNGGGYGTCITIERAMDESSDILLAFMQNGEKLRPDHGYPVRAIVPGMIGGRMVKWLTKITITEEPSTNYYHNYDNKVFPSHVDSEVANAEGWWTRPEYVITELNINSVITTPAHGEVVPINPGTMYTIGGYAYSGGGRTITRVEITLDDGLTWLQCDITRPEKPTKYGKHWCWIFWQVDVEVVELLQAREVAVRAWDESLNTQPKDLIWNLMGMMNNCWFRVKTHPCRAKLGGVALAFEHPTQPGNQSGGWMVKKKDGQDGGAGGGAGTASSSGGGSGGLVKSASSPFLQQKATRAITMAEVRRHNKAESPWIIVHNAVYDCTAFLKDHPGGADSILINAGDDCTEEFDAIHSSKAKALLEDFRIGELVLGGSNWSSSADTSPESSIHGGTRVLAALSLGTIQESTPPSPKTPTTTTIFGKKPVALANPKQAITCRLVHTERLGSDLRKLRFALPSSDQVLGLPTGKHVFISAKVAGKLAMRAYTPLSADDDEDCVGHFELLIRVYFAGVHPKFPAGGVMSQHLDLLKPGDTVAVKGPLGHIHYQARGNFSISGKQMKFRQLALLAGGTGITPIYALLKAILRDPEDRTETWLVYANRREEDIMLREELDKWEKEHPEKLHVWYVLSGQPPSEWRYSVGYVTEEIVKQHLPKGDSDATAAFMCGPLPMIEFACLPNLAKHGYSKELCFQF